MFLRKCAACGKDVPNAMLVCPYCRANEKGEAAEIPVDKALFSDPRIQADIEALANSDRTIRQAAADRLVAKAHAVVPVLIEVLGDHTHKGLNEVARLLGRIRDRRCMPGLIECLKVGNEELRASAVWALSQFNESLIPEEVLLEAERNNPTVQAYIAHAFAGHPDARMVPLLKKLTFHASPEVAFQALWALGERGEKSAIPALRRQLSRQEAVIRTAAESALRRLGGPVRRIFPLWGYAVLAGGVAAGIGLALLYR